MSKWTDIAPQSHSVTELIEGLAQLYVPMINGDWRKTAPRLWSQEHLGVGNSRKRVCGQFILPVSLVHLIHVVIAPVRQGRGWSNRQAPGHFQAGSPTNVRRREPQCRADVGVIERQTLSL